MTSGHQRCCDAGKGEGVYKEMAGKFLRYRVQRSGRTFRLFKRQHVRIEGAPATVGTLYSDARLVTIGLDGGIR